MIIKFVQKVENIVFCFQLRTLTVETRNVLVTLLRIQPEGFGLKLRQACAVCLLRKYPPPPPHFLRNKDALTWITSYMVFMFGAVGEVVCNVFWRQTIYLHINLSSLSVSLLLELQQVEWKIVRDSTEKERKTSKEGKGIKLKITFVRDDTMHICCRYFWIVIWIIYSERLKNVCTFL